MAPSTGRSLRRLLFGAVVAVAFLGGALAVVSQTATFRDWLRREVLVRLNATLAGRVEVGRLDGNLFGGLTATNVRVTLEGRRVLAIRRVAATYDVLSLAGGGPLRIRTLVGDGVALQLVGDEHGWNVERLTREPAAMEDDGRDVVLERVQLADAAVRVIRPERVWRLRDVALAGTATFGAARSSVTVERFGLVEVGSGVRLEEAAGAATVDRDGGMVLDDLRIRSAGSELAVTGRIGPRAARSADLRLRVARLSGNEVQALFGRSAPRSDWEGALQASGPPAAVALAGDLHAGFVENGVARDGGRATLAGTIDLSGETPHGEIRATLAHVDLGVIAGPRVPPSDLSGTVSLGSVAGAPGAVRFGIELAEPRVGTTSLTSLAASGTADRESVRFEADAATTAGSAHAGGTIALAAERYDLRLTATRIDPATLTGMPRLAGEVSGSATVVGAGFTPARMRTDVTLAIAPSRVGGVRVTTGTLAARAADGRITLARATLEGHVGTLEASGDLALDAARTANGPGNLRADAGGVKVHSGGLKVHSGGLKADARLTDLRPLAQLIGQPGFAGSATVTVAARGAPNALDATVAVRGRSLAGPGWRAGGLEADLAAQRLGSPQGDATLTAHARDVVAADRTFVAADFTGRWQGDAATGRGTVDVRARATDAQHRLAADVRRGGDETRVTVTALRVDLGEDTWVTTGTPVLVVRGDRVAIEDLTVRSARGSGRLRGVLARAGANDLDLVLEGLDLAALESWIPEEVRGRLAGRAHLGGTAAAPRLDADLAVANPTFGGTRYEELRARLDVEGGRAAVRVRLAQAPTQALDFDGTVPVRFTVEPWSFGVTGDATGRLQADAVDLAFVGALWPQLVTKVGGTVSADLQLGGAWNAPEARGTVALADGRAHVVPLGLTYDPVTLALRFDGRAMSVERLDIQSGEGRLTGGGNARLVVGAGLDDATSMDARFEAKRFPLFANQYGRGSASGWLWISGTLAAPVVEGSLTTDGLVLQIPETLPGRAPKADSTIVVVGPAAPPAPPERPAAPDAAPVPGFYDRAAITVQLAVPRDAWVRRSDANVELQGWMTAWKKPGDELHLAGDIRGVRGWYAFQGKKFALAEGSVRFSGQGLDPVLDITATHQAGDYLVRLKVGGTITKPALALESEPALPQADVLAVLLFGAPADQLNRSQSMGLREQALGIAGGYVASELRQSVANALGVDDLQFDTGNAGLQDARVSIGKYVADDIFVSLAHKFGAQSVEEIRIEYIIRPGWSLETSSDTLGRSGIDLFWKRRY